LQDERQAAARARGREDHRSDYTGQGATEEQFVKTMATAGIRVLFAREVES
jgi:hypothetical protein